jgi:hypothetical protein
MSKINIEHEISVNGNTNLIADSGLNTGAQVFAVGDSHTIFFYNSMKVKEHWGYEGKIPLTVYTLLRDGLDVYNVGNLLGNGHEKYNVKNGDYVIFYYGFNDIQRNIHIHSKNTWKEDIDGLFTNYVEYIVSLKEKYGIIPIIPSVYPNPLPQAKGQNPSGSYEERNKYTIEANRIIQERCKKHCILYLDIHEKITDVNGFIKNEYTTDYIHLDYNNTVIRSIIETYIFEIISNKTYNYVYQ